MRDAYFLIQNEMAQMKRNVASEVSKLEFEERKKLFAKRQAIVEDVFKKARGRLLEFVSSPDYVDVLKRYAVSISKVLKNPERPCISAAVMRDMPMISVRLTAKSARLK